MGTVLCVFIPCTDSRNFCQNQYSVNTKDVPGVPCVHPAPHALPTLCPGGQSPTPCLLNFGILRILRGIVSVCNLGRRAFPLNPGEPSGLLCQQVCSCLLLSGRPNLSHPSCLDRHFGFFFSCYEYKCYESVCTSVCVCVNMFSFLWDKRPRL